MGQLEGSKGQLEGSESQLEGSEGHPAGSDGQPGGTYIRIYIHIKFLPILQDLVPSLLHKKVLGPANGLRTCPTGFKARLRHPTASPRGHRTCFWGLRACFKDETSNQRGLMAKHQCLGQSEGSEGQL